MAVVRNLMIRIGADYSAAKKGMDGATRELTKFRRDTERSISTVNGKRGIGGLKDSFRTASSSVTSAVSELRGAKGLGGVVSGLSALRPAVGAAASSLAGLGTAAGGVAASLGPVGIAIGVVTAALGAMVGAVALASQEAVKFEATIGRLNMQLKGGSREFLDWARAQGLAKTEAAEMGATYSVLLSSFIKDTKSLQQEVQKLTQATRVVASNTGRSIEDTLERMRSGLLGNTEAIEDLGIFVNVSMIESTNAFKKFANGKSWDQLNFQVQQQIRLAAILEQAYARYGNQLQQNVMTRQNTLIAQLKDIKLNLSQAFLPIWDAVLPALTRMAEGVAYLTEQLARFAYWVRGWDYDEMTKGTDKQTDAVDDQSKSYDDLAKSASKARGQLAAFDEINQIGDYGVAGSGGGSGGSGGKPGNPGKPGDRPSIEPPKLPEIPELPKLQLKFDPPAPPDGGIGAVATAVISTVTEMIANVKRMMADMWNSLVTQTVGFKLAIIPEWQQIQNVIQQLATPLTNIRVLWVDTLAYMQSVLRSYVPSLVMDWRSLQNAIQQLTNPLANLRANWQLTLETMLSQLNTYRPLIEQGWLMLQAVIQQTEIPLSIVRNAWQLTLDYMRSQLNLARPIIEGDWKSIQNAIQQTEIPLANTRSNWQMSLVFMQTQLNAVRPYLEFGWQLIQNAIQQTETPLANIKALWHETLDSMQSQLNAYRPYLEAGWAMIGLSVMGLVPALTSVKISWADALESMLSKVQQAAKSIIREINEMISAWTSMESALFGSRSRAKTYDYTENRNTAPATNTGRSPVVDNMPVVGGLLEGLDWVRDNISAPLKPISEQVLVPGGNLGGAGNLASGSASQAAGALSKYLKGLQDLLKGLDAVPQMAKGGIVSSPTLAMIGEAGTEAVVPLEDTSFVDAIGSAVGTAVLTALQMAGGNQAAGTGGDIVVNLDGATLARVLLPYTQREQQRQGPTVIREV